MKDAELGDAIIAFGVKRLDKRGRRAIKERRNAIVLGELYPLKHLGWRDETAYSHPKVEVPKIQRGQFASKEEPMRFEVRLGAVKHHCGTFLRGWPGVICGRSSISR